MNMWLVAYLVFSIANILFVLWVMRALASTKFRSQDGDLTTEVGFEEYPTGAPKQREYNFPSEDELEEPHMGAEKLMQ